MAFKIKVPGSTANLGPGFDSIGLALNRYLELECAPSDQWSFRYHSPGYESLPTDKSNFIYKIYQKTAEQYGLYEPLPACRVDLVTDIPLERGLGSSAAAVVAGIELADQLLSLRLTKEEKAILASRFEGHPDNAGASVYGGLTIGSHSDHDTIIIPCGNIPLDIIMMIPDNHLLTEAARNLLPDTLGFNQAIRGSSLANVLVAALLKGDIESLSRVMAKDVFHQPYRMPVVPDLSRVISLLSDGQPCGVALSGAGPSILIAVEKRKGDIAREKLVFHFPDYTIDILEPEANGSTVSLYPAL